MTRTILALLAFFPWHVHFPDALACARTCNMWLRMKGKHLSSSFLGSASIMLFCS